jgi:predicted permease
MRMGELWRRLWFLLNRSRFERELQDEMDAHRAMRGESGPRFGNALRLREEAADEWGWAWLDRLGQDVRFALRLLRRAPLFTAAAMAVLALGVGINLGAFQVLDAVAFSPLPVRAPERLVKIEPRNPSGHSTTISYPAFAFYRSRSSQLASAFALIGGSVTLADDQTRRIEAEFVSGNYFSDLGARPLAGRLLHPLDDRPEAAPVVVLAERIWRTRFGSDPAMIGGPLRVNGRPFIVAGIVPETFVGLDDRGAGAWMAVAHHREAFPGSRVTEEWSATVRFYARLADGVTLPAAEAGLAPLATELHGLHPREVPRGEWLDLTEGGRYMPLERANGAGLVLVGALVMLVLIAACMNLGLLVLARTLGRDREFAIRLSVGASRARIVRQLLTEHLLLACAGAAVGCAVAVAASRAIALYAGLPSGIAPHFTVRSFGVAIGLAIVSSFLFGFTPAIQSMRPAASRRMRLRNALVGVQVAAASVLLIVSGLVVRGVTRVVRIPLGFDYQQTVVVHPDLSAHGVSASAADAYWKELDARVRAVPGVAGAAISTLAPFGNRVTINSQRTVIYGVTPSYFHTMRIPVKQGRIFAEGEAKVALLGETLARRLWPGEDPIGKSYDGATVVGVVGNARTVRIGDGSATEAYMPIRPRELPESVMIVRVNGAPHDAAATLLSLARGAQNTFSPSVVLLPEALERKLESPRQFAVVASTLGVCALLLAVTGLAGMIAFSVTQRVREIGVRMALGAQRRDVVRAIARQFAAPVVGGALAGSVLAAGVGTILYRELFGVSQLDPVSHGGALLLFAAVATVAALPSLRRAVRVNPIDALRHE